MRRRHSLAVLAGYAVLAVAFTYPLVRQFTIAIPGDGFDGWQNYWNLWWTRSALLEQHASPFFTNLLYAPTGVGLLFHTLNLFNGLASLPAQLSWGLFPAYNLVVLFSFVAGGYGTYLLARLALGPGSSRVAAFAAGIVFAFSPFHVAHVLGHLQVLSLEWIPFYVLYLLRLGRQAGIFAPVAHSAPRSLLHDGLMAGLFLVLLGLCDWYFVLYCLILTALALAWAGVVTLARRRSHIAADGRQAAGAPRMPHFFAGVALAGLTFAGVLSPVLVPMLKEARQYRFMVPDPGQSRTFSADLLAFITPQEFHPLWGHWAAGLAQVFTSTVAEHQVFAGYSVLVVALLGVTWARRHAAAAKARPAGLGFWLLALATFFVLALGPVLHVGGHTTILPGDRELSLPYGWLSAHIPFMDISRSVSRFDVMVMLILAVLAAVGLQWLMGMGRLGKLATYAAAAAMVFEFWPAPYPLSLPDTPAWYQVLATDPRSGSVLNLPMNWDRPGYLLYQTVHGKPLAAAYISREDPRTLVERAPVLQHFRHLGPDIIDLDLAAQGRQVLADLGVMWVVLDRYKMPGEAERGYNESTAGLIFAGQQPVYRDQRLTVYQVDRPSSLRPYLVLGEGWQSFSQGTRSRTFTGEASLDVQAPGPGSAVLSVTLAPGSAALAAPGDGLSYRLPLELRQGVNRIALQAREPASNVTVVRLAIE